MDESSKILYVGLVVHKDTIAVAYSSGGRRHQGGITKRPAIAMPGARWWRGRGPIGIRRRSASICNSGWRSCPPRSRRSAGKRRCVSAVGIGSWPLAGNTSTRWWSRSRMRWPHSRGRSRGSCSSLPDRSPLALESRALLRTNSRHRRRRGPGIGAIFDRVRRPRPSSLERSRRRDGHQYGDTQSTDTSMINRRRYRLRRFRWFEPLLTKSTTPSAANRTHDPPSS